MVFNREHPSDPCDAPQYNAHLVGRGTTAEEFMAALNQAAFLAAQAIHTADHPVPQHEPGDISELVNSIDLATPQHTLEDCFRELREIWLDSAVFYHHPNYISHLNCPVALPAVAADVLATSLNTAVESWDQAGAAAHIEQRLIRWISEAVGFPPSANGVFTSGGSQSNLQALAIARNKTRVEAPLKHLAFFASPGAHYSVRRAAELLGIEPENMITVGGAHADSGMIEATALRAAIARARADRLTPAAVVATAGTTDRGLIDPLSDIADVCDAERVHLHVDAAYGGAACFSAQHRSRLRGIDRADSITIDFHKTFFQPLACSAVVMRSGSDLSYVRSHAEYLNPASSAHLNLADYSLQTSRRFDALKLWVTLRTVGAEAIGTAFDRVVALAHNTARAIEHSEEFADLDLFEHPHLSTVLFSLHGDPDGTLVEPVRDALFTSGTAAVAVTRIGEKRLMKLTILDPTLSLGDITGTLRAVVRTSHDYAAHSL